MNVDEQALYDKMMHQLVGLDARTSVWILVSLIANIIAYASDDYDKADGYVSDVARIIRSGVQTNWQLARQLRAEAKRQG